jgi:hypothetical protein
MGAAASVGKQPCSAFTLTPGLPNIDYARADGSSNPSTGDRGRAAQGRRSATG